MRRPRDFDTELKALDTRAQQLKSRKLLQLGELVTATGADGLTIEELAGALLAAVATAKGSTASSAGGNLGGDLFPASAGSARTIREGWQRAGAAFFQRGSKRSAIDADQVAGGGDAQPSGVEPPTSPGGAR